MTSLTLPQYLRHNVWENDAVQAGGPGRRRCREDRFDNPGMLRLTQHQ